jgi:hypothetical protein
MRSMNVIGLLCAVFLFFPTPKSTNTVTCKYANQPDAADNSYAVHDGVCQRCQAGSDNGTWIDRYCTECQTALSNSLSRSMPSPRSKKSSPAANANDPCDTSLYSDGARRYANNRYEVCTWGPNEWVEKVPDTHTVCNQDQSSGASALSRTDTLRENHFIGRIYDLDYLAGQGYTQVLIRPTEGDAGLVASTTNDRLQRILEIALVNDTQVQGTYSSGEPGRLLTIAMRPETSCSQQGCVQEIRCSTVDDICLATITGQSEVKTKSSRAFGVLLAALDKKKPVEYLTVDKEGFVLRVKINEP